MLRHHISYNLIPFFFSFFSQVVRFKLGYLPANTRNFPKYKALVVGLLFCCHNFLNYMGNRGNLVEGPVSVLILQVTSQFEVIHSFLGSYSSYNDYVYFPIKKTVGGISVVE
jgi:hypothetical protein